MTSAELDISQFMDVVTTFKCKACSFICSKQEELCDHIKGEHLTTTTTAKEPDVAAANNTSVAKEMCSSSSTDVQAEDHMTQEDVVQGLLEASASSGLAQIQIQTFVNGQPTDQVVLVDTAAASDENRQLLVDSANAASQELFLCGQCSAGFPTIDVCKEHMAKEHSITEWGSDDNTVSTSAEDQLSKTSLGDQASTEPTISDRVEHNDNKVSIATQMEKKRAGRKTKTEIEEEQKLQEQDKDMEHDYAYIEEPGKRKRRMPIHLIQDFAVPKTAKIAPISTKKQAQRIEKKKKQSAFMIKCNDCRARFQDESSLEYHLTTHSTNELGDTIYLCPEKDCDEKGKPFSCSIWSDFKMHAWKAHEMDLGMFKCDICDHRSTHFSKLLIHKEVHSEKKPYKCEVCHKGFKQSSQLKNHNLIHGAGMDVTEKESSSGRHWFVQSQCNICKRTFANGKSLACHVEAVHDKVKPYKCQFCGHTAARKAMMQLHLRTHTGEKPFKCDLCEYSTGDHNSLRRHRMRHSGEKPYQCPHCPYACIQAVSLKLHLKSKHPGSESFYSCNKCLYRTVNKTLFVNHARDHEIGLIESIDQMPSTELHEISEDQFQLANSQIAGSGGIPIKLGTINDMTNGTSNTTQLICSALNAIAHNLTEDGDPLPDNIETTVHTISSDSGIKAHKITFHIPPTGNKNAKTAEVVVQEAAVPMDPLQVATMAHDIPTNEATISNDIQTTEGSEDEVTATATVTLE